MYLQNVSMQSQAVCDGIIDRETAILGQLQRWTWIKRLIKAQNAALNPQVRLLMEPNLINSSHIGWKCWDRKDVEKYGNIMNLKVAIGPSLNTRPVLQISKDLIDGKGPAERWLIMARHEYDLLEVDGKDQVPKI